MKSITICLIIFHTAVFGKNFLVEVANDPKEKVELSSNAKLEAELSNSLEEDIDKDIMMEEGKDVLEVDKMEDMMEEDIDKDMTKTAGNDYGTMGLWGYWAKPNKKPNKNHSSYARSATDKADGSCGGDNILIVLH